MSLGMRWLKERATRGTRRSRLSISERICSLGVDWETHFIHVLLCAGSNWRQEDSRDSHWVDGVSKLSYWRNPQHLCLCVLECKWFLHQQLELGGRS